MNAQPLPLLVLVLWLPLPTTELGTTPLDGAMAGDPPVLAWAAGDGLVDELILGNGAGAAGAWVVIGAAGGWLATGATVAGAGAGTDDTCEAWETCET
jgi:hypothetical protein